MSDGMKKNRKIILGVIGLLIIVIIVILGYLYLTGMTTTGGNGWDHVPLIVFEADDTLDILTVTIYGEIVDIPWSDIEIQPISQDGSATLPTGTIDVGDIISDCQGEFDVIFKPVGISLRSFSFES